MADAIVSEPVATGAPQRGRVIGDLRLTHPARGYAVTRNPLAIWAVLPAIVLAFIGLGIWEWAQPDLVVFFNSVVDVSVVTFCVVTLGLLLIPAVALKGSLNLTPDGVTFERGKHHFTAGWDQVQGLEYRRDCGLCLVMGSPQATSPMKLPGGFRVDAEHAVIPLRMFGDRQYSIIYDVRDRVPEANWRPAVEQVTNRSSLRILAVYGLTVLICCLAMGIVAFALTH